MDIGILGGTFDPIHFGHLAIAEEARRKLVLSRVIFVPAGQPWLKTGREITPARHRIKMIEIAIEDVPYLEVSTVEINRPGPSYTVVTLAYFQEMLGKDTGIFFLVGWDSLKEFPKWYNPLEVLKICRLVAFSRNGKEPPDLEILEKSVPGIKKNTLLIDMEPVDISSTNIRERATKGLPLRGLVPEEVEKYIAEQKLYR